MSMSPERSNPAPAVDGGIPLQFQIRRPRPAATEERRWAHSRHD